MAGAAVDLAAVAIVEKDKHGDVLVAWSYPQIDNNTEGIILDRAQLTAPADTLCYSYSKHKSLWEYYMPMTVPGDSATLPAVSAVSVVILSKTFNPEKFQALLTLLAGQYVKTGDPIRILGSYLSVFTTKQVKVDDESWSASAYNDKQALLAGCSLTSFISLFGVHSVLVYNAMVLKKRVVVVADSMEALLPMVRVLPQLVWSRQNWQILRPFVTLAEAEIADLESSGVYVAIIGHNHGNWPQPPTHLRTNSLPPPITSTNHAPQRPTPCTTTSHHLRYVAGLLDGSVRSREDLFDVLVDVSAREVTIAEHSKDDFRMGDLHKEVATFMVQGAESGDVADDVLIKGIFQRTNKCLELVKELAAADPTLSTETMEARNVPASTQRFMYNLAIAEGVISR